MDGLKGLSEIAKHMWYELLGLVLPGGAFVLLVPANRIGYAHLSVPQLKVLQEIITLSVFVPFSLLYLREPLKLDYLWAGLCLCGAAYFMLSRRS